MDHEGGLKVPEQSREGGLGALAGTLLDFLENVALHDCFVKVPGEPSRDIPCHRVILSAGSRYFAQLFLHGSPEESKDAVVDLPTLPPDDRLRAQICAAFPLVLKFLYTSQDVDAMRAILPNTDAEGLFAAAVLLQMPTLVEVTAAHIMSNVLGPSTAARLLSTSLWLQDTLGDHGSSLGGISARFSQELRRGFMALQPHHELAPTSDLLSLFSHLPVSAILDTLEADDLEVDKEGDVLDVVKHVLKERCIEDADAAAPAESSAAEPAEGERKESSPNTRGPFSKEQAAAVLGACRLAHLSHEQLIAASRDPLLLRVGAEAQKDGTPGFVASVLDALSSRLSHHEPVQDGSRSVKPPRPSTLRHSTSLAPHRYAAPPPVAPPFMEPRPLASMEVLTPDHRGGIVATLESPLLFRHARDFDEGGALFWLGTSARTQAWRNPASLGHVQPLASSIGYGIQAKCEDIVGRAAVSLRTANEPQSYFGVDLRGERLLVASGYCLRNRDSTSHVLLSWIFQGSVDGVHWQTLDERSQQQCFRESGATAFFAIAGMDGALADAGPPFRCFRVVQTTKNSSNSFNLALSCIELYGRAVRGSWP
mmetsp:Transcript_33095/g.73777  ORF Transcript_33095/g.73777 Transcript_33095/m.73777 type:complete len:595 (+) Transcript_33095:61-1845(+)